MIMNNDFLQQFALGPVSDYLNSRKIVSNRMLYFVEDNTFFGFSFREGDDILWYTSEGNVGVIECPYNIYQ